MRKYERVWVGVKFTNPTKYKRGWRLVPPVLKIDDWLKGNVVGIKHVPKPVRGVYRDTLTRAARAARRYGKPIWVNSSYRDPFLQQQMYEMNMKDGKPRPGRPLTARPGTSPHERGIGLDIPDARITHPLIKYLREELLMDDVKSEKWHLTNHAALRKGA